MKRLVLVLVIALGAYSQRAHAQNEDVDTVGFWKVQCHGNEISAVTINSEKTYFLSSVNDTDKVDIYYYNATPCAKCQCKLQLHDTSGITFKTFERRGYGDSRPFTLIGKDINPELAKGRVYMYFIIRYDGWEPPIFIGALRLSK